MPDPDNDEWISVEQAAKALAVSEPTIRRWINDDRLTASRIGPRLWRIRRSALDQMS